MKGTIASNQMRQPITGLRNPNTESIENGEYDGVFASCLEDGLGFLTFNAEVEEPRVLESLTQIHKDQKHADGGQSDESFHAGFSKPMPFVFEEDDISLIATYLGKPIMLDSYTSAMCKDSWGRSSFVRCLIEINSETDFKESITIGIPEFDGPRFIKETIPFEYEWKPPRCHTCNIFGHTGDSCPKKVVVTPVANDTNDTNDGFQKVVNKKRNNKGKSAGNIIPRGVPRQKDVVDSGKMKLANIATPNPFTTLGEEEDEEEDVENIYDESENLNIKNTGASTPAQMVVNENNLSVCAILESHVDVAIVYDTFKKVCSMWKWTSNGSLCSKGSRIILGWNDDIVDVMIMAQTNQVMHVQLWNDLVGHTGLMRNRPWILLGDFNATLNLKDHSAGDYELNAAMREFKEFVPFTLSRSHSF
ncbi:hypothetical protein Tco_0184712 [Tanacetum coccineum]